MDIAVAETGPGDEWQRVVARFETGDQADAATMSVTKTGPGVAFVDDLSLVGVVEGIEPRLPGFAPLPARPRAKPIPPRRSTVLPIPSCRTAPTVDGAVAQDEYPGAALDVWETPGRTRAAGPPCAAWVTHRDGTLYVAVTVPLKTRPALTARPQWTVSDGAEVCFSFPDPNAQHPTFILHGFPDGTCESSTEAGDPPQAARVLGQAVRYAANVSAEAWTAEWAVPLSAVDLEVSTGFELDFNVGVFRREAKQWIQWAGTHAQTWRVKQAGRIRLGD